MRKYIVNVIFYLLYLLIGFAQFFAIWDAIELYLDWGIFDFLVALSVTYIPLLGSILGYFGATEVWRWEPWQAVALFFWYLPILAFLFFTENSARD